MNIKLSGKFNKTICDVICAIDEKYINDVLTILDVYVHKDVVISTTHNIYYTLIYSEKQLIKTLNRLKQNIDAGNSNINVDSIIQEVFSESLLDYVDNDIDCLEITGIIEELKQTKTCCQTYINENLDNRKQISHIDNWYSVDTLPKVGEPVLVLLTNNCINIDWVDEPDGDVPFAHFIVKGWRPISYGNHFSIVKKSSN